MNINKFRLIIFVTLTISVLFALGVSFSIVMAQNNQLKAETISPNDEVVESVKLMKLAFVPDVNLSFEQHDGLIMYNESLVILQDVVKSLNKTTDLDLVLFGGDMTDNRDKETTDLPMFLDSVLGLKVPYYVILGDRDVDLSENYSKEDVCSEFKYNGFSDKSKTYWAVEPLSNVLLVGLDTTIKNASSGSLSPEQLIWLNETLKKSPDKVTIISMHHPAIPSCSQDKVLPWKNFVLSNSNEFLNIIRNYPQVKVVLSGHHYINQIQKVDNVLFISTPSVSVYPNEFKILTIYSDKVEVENKKISFNQIVKKAKKSIVESDYASQYDSQKPQNVLKYQEGDKYSRGKKFYYQDKK